MRTALRLIGPLLLAVPLTVGAVWTARAQSPRAAPWVELTPKAGLAGWRVMGGQAPYVVEGGELVGRCVSPRPVVFCRDLRWRRYGQVGCASCLVGGAVR